MTVLVCGPPRAGVSAVAAALAAAGVDVVEPGALRTGVTPVVVVFVISAAGRPVASDFAVLDRVLGVWAADRVLGVVSKIDAHRRWRDAVAIGLARYPALPWSGVAAAPNLGEPRIGELLEAVRSRLELPREVLLDSTIGDMTQPGRQSRVVPLRSRTQQARVQLGALVRRRCADLRTELTDAGGVLTRRSRAAFPDVVRAGLERAAADIDDAVTEHLAVVAAELGLRDVPSPAPLEPPAPAPPAAMSGTLESRLAVLLGIGFGLGVAVTLGRFVADLMPGHAALGILPGLFVGAALTGWVVLVRRLLAERVAMQRWAASGVDGLRGAADEAVALRIVAAERHWGPGPSPPASSESMYMPM